MAFATPRFLVGKTVTGRGMASVNAGRRGMQRTTKSTRIRQTVTGILWLASYPKSGNTWLRVFLANLFQNADQPVDINKLGGQQFGDMEIPAYERLAGKPVAEMDDAELHRLRPRVHQEIAQSSQDTALVKTHNAMALIDDIPLVTPEVTRGAIYVLRNPFDVAISYAHHYGVTLDDAIAALGSSAHRVQTNDRSVFQYLGSWSGHVRGWGSAEGLNLLVLKYEDMQRDPMKTFGRVTKYLGLPKDPRRLRKAIKFSSFKELSDQEARRGFGEKSRYSDRFFRSGRSGGWRTELSPAQMAQLVEDHDEILREFGYLKPDGKIIT